MKAIPDICVVGTDTGIGKTVVSLLLMQWLYAKGYDPFYLKPFQTGCADPYDVDSDAAFVYRHTPALKTMDPAPSVVFCYPNPKAPLYAARDAGETIDENKVRRRIKEVPPAHSPLVVEGAGGLLVPVTRNRTVADLLASLNCRPLLVARAGLGTINHTLLSIEALHRRNLSPVGVVLVQSSGIDEDPGLVEENMAAIGTFSGVQVAGVVPAISDFSAPPATAYHFLESLFGAFIQP